MLSVDIFILLVKNPWCLQNRSKIAWVVVSRMALVKKGEGEVLMLVDLVEILMLLFDPDRAFV